MKKMWKWLKANKLATVCIICITWLAHYSIETFIVNNIIKLAGFTTPTLTII